MPLALLVRDNGCPITTGGLWLDSKDLVVRPVLNERKRRGISAAEKREALGFRRKVVAVLSSHNNDVVQRLPANSIPQNGASADGGKPDGFPVAVMENNRNVTGHNDGTAVGVSGDPARGINVKSHIRLFGEGIKILVSGSEVALQGERNVGKEQEQPHGFESKIRGHTQQAFFGLAAPKAGHEPGHGIGVPQEHPDRNEAAEDPYGCRKP